MVYDHPIVKTTAYAGVSAVLLKRRGRAGHENAVIDEIMFIEKGGCGSSHGGAQAALPTNIDLSRRLVQKKCVGLASLRRANVLVSSSEQRAR